MGSGNHEPALLGISFVQRSTLYTLLLLLDDGRATRNSPVSTDSLVDDFECMPDLLAQTGVALGEAADCFCVCCAELTLRECHGGEWEEGCEDATALSPSLRRMPSNHL